MYFIYRKSFDLGRTRNGNVPRLANVNLSTFGQWGVSLGRDEAPGYIITQDVDAGLKDLISYGLEELKKVEFSEIQDGEVLNFQRGLAAEIKNVAERMVSMLNHEVAIAAIQHQQDHILRIAERDLVGFDISNLSSNNIYNVSSLRDYGNNVVRAMSLHQRRQVPREFIETERLYFSRPAVGGGILPSARGYLDSVIKSASVNLSLGSLTDTGDYTVSAPQLVVDSNRVNSRYVRYLQYLAHTYSPIRLRITGGGSDQAIYIQMVFDYGFLVDQYYEMYRPDMPDCTIANPTTQQKVLLSLLVASKYMIDLAERRVVPDECFANPTIDGFTQALGERIASNISIPYFKPGEEIMKHHKSITEALWSLSKLRGSILPSTSLDFPELTQFLQPTSAA